MGCWNATCSLSRLPIECGDQVRAFIIAPHWAIKSSGFSYPDDAFIPMSFGILGEYDDYGLIDNIIENYNTEMIMDIFKEIEEKDIYELLRKIERDYIYDIGKGFFEHKYICNEKSEERKGKNIGFTLVREDIYQKIIDIRKNQKCWLRDHEGELFNDLYITAGIEYFQSLYDHNNDDDPTFHRLIYSDKNHFYYDIKHHFDYWVENNYENFILRKMTSTNTSDIPQVKDLVKDAVDMMQLRGFMSELRLSWMPQSGKGSQCPVTRDYIPFYSFVLEKAYENIDYWKKQEEEDEEEEE
jgi:hypothetical protein